MSDICQEVDEDEHSIEMQLIRDQQFDEYFYLKNTYLGYASYYITHNFLKF